MMFEKTKMRILVFISLLITFLPCRMAGAVVCVNIRFYTYNSSI